MSSFQEDDNSWLWFNTYCFPPVRCIREDNCEKWTCCIILKLLFFSFFFINTAAQLTILFFQGVQISGRMRFRMSKWQNSLDKVMLLSGGKGCFVCVYPLCSLFKVFSGKLCASSEGLSCRVQLKWYSI